MKRHHQVPAAVREGRELLDHFYGFSRRTDPDRYLLQDNFRQDTYRLIVFQLQLAIEELVRAFVFDRLTVPPDPGTFTHEKNVEFVQNLSSRQLLELAGRLHILSKAGFDELVKLNSIRNKCAHNWQLHSFTVKEKIRASVDQVEPEPYIEFEGRNLLTPTVVRDEFLPRYGDIYVELWAVRNGVELDERIYTDPTLEAIEEP